MHAALDLISRCRPGTLPGRYGHDDGATSAAGDATILKCTLCLALGHGLPPVLDPAHHRLPDAEPFNHLPSRYGYRGWATTLT
jgi:hypothetical protein